jgi:hypothetical protein
MAGMQKFDVLNIFGENKILKSKERSIASK